MTPTDWDTVFDQADRNPPLPTGLRDAVSSSVTTPLDAEEREALSQEKVPDPDRWTFPAHPLPATYLDFLAWSNGGLFVNGERELQMLAAEELREYMLTYRLPLYLPGMVPFATDGRGNFYLFDLRNPPDAAGEYPVVFAAVGDAGAGETAAAVVVAGSFPEVCRGRTDPDDNAPDPT